MRVAVLLTGALRTIKKTMRYFKQNVVLNPDVHIFACVQNTSDTPNAEWDDWDNWLREQLGDNLKSVQWFSLDNFSEWVKHRDLLISSITIPDNWKNYLRTSGSMIEYIQLQYAYMKMGLFEATGGFKYSHIIKSRTDTIYAKPVDFHWLNWSDEQVAARLQLVNEELALSKIEVNPVNSLRYFMSTIISDDFIPNIHNISAFHLPSRDGDSVNLGALNSYIKNGSYILTIRVNNLYVVRRDLFYLIPSLGTMYGLLHYPHQDDYWFNAENQFRAACYHSNLAIFDYYTLFEDRSLYEYDERRYFDLDYNLINPNMLYCVIRN